MCRLRSHYSWLSPGKSASTAAACVVAAVFLDYIGADSLVVMNTDLLDALADDLLEQQTACGSSGQTECMYA